MSCVYLRRLPSIPRTTAAMISRVSISRQLCFASKFLNVPAQVLRGELVERALVRPLQHGPQGLDTVRVDITPDVLHRAVVDRFVRVRKGLVDQRIVAVDSRIGVGVLLQRNRGWWPCRSAL